MGILVKLILIVPSILILVTLVTLGYTSDIFCFQVHLFIDKFSRVIFTMSLIKNSLQDDLT